MTGDSISGTGTAFSRRAKQPGRIEKTLIRWLVRPAVVGEVRPLSAGFRLIDLEGKALQGVAWVPGQKIQVMLGGLLTARTYTPTMWDTAGGRTRILAWSHGPGPGSDWASTLAAGDACQFFGPRRSLDGRGHEDPVILVGDETSFGLALAFAGSADIAIARMLFEVSDARESETVLRDVGLSDAVLIERSDDDSHLAAIEHRLAEFAAGTAIFVLTGRAAAIQRLSRILKALGVSSSRLRTKAYWAPGKTGLD